MNIELTRAKKWSMGAAVLLIVVCGSAYAMQETQESDVPVDDLLVEFKDVLKDRRVHMAAQYKDGRLRYSDMLVAENELLEAELSVIVDPSERIAALEKQLQNCKLLEKQMAARADVGQVTGSELLEAKTRRLMAEIKLKRVLE